MTKKVTKSQKFNKKGGLSPVRRKHSSEMKPLFPRRSEFSSAQVDSMEIETLNIFKIIKEHEDLSHLAMGSQETQIGPA